MKLIEVFDATAWDAFQTAQPWAQFTQSWAWGEYRLSQGQMVRRFALMDEGGVWCVAAQLEYRPKPLVGGYWFAARGPVFASGLTPEETQRYFVLFLKELSGVDLQKSLFWRFEPMVELSRVLDLMPRECHRTGWLDPASTICVDLQPDEQTLLDAMHQKTRYNIRLAAKHGVTVRLAETEKDMEGFLKLFQETMQRDAFVHHVDHIRASYQFLAERGMARIRLAEHQGTMLAANVEVMYGDTVTYLHGASSSEHRQLMAPFALQWDAICTAKREGYCLYDFWGANPESKNSFFYKASLEGVTRFKRGWGGRQVDLYGTWDMPRISWLYKLVFLKNRRFLSS